MAFSTAYRMQRYYKENTLPAQTLSELISIKTRLGNIIKNDLYPGSKLCMFGSSLSGFGTNDSDVDCCLWFAGQWAKRGNPRDQGSNNQKLTAICNHLRRMRSSNPVTEIDPSVQEDPVPVLKCVHRRHRKSIDITVNMIDGGITAFLMRKYKDCSDVVAPLGVIIKQWRSKQRLSVKSTACVLMVINYMQVKGYLPVFQPLDPRSNTRISWDNFSSRLDEVDIQQLEQMMMPDGRMPGPGHTLFTCESFYRSTPSLDELVKGFFEYYADFSFETSRIMVRNGRVEQRARSSEPVFVQEPVVGDNSTASIRGDSFRHLKNELRRAREILRRPGGDWEAIFR